jgi:hypothetical protein
VRVSYALLSAVQRIRQVPSVAVLVLSTCLLLLIPTQQAFADGTRTINESVRTHLVKHQGTTILDEQGQGSGTFDCPLTVQFVISYTRATVTFTCQTSSGTISGRGSTSFYVAGAIAYFNGSIPTVHGTGRYSRAAARDLSIKGTLRRGSYALSAQVSGTLAL